ncbi:MAG: DUF305 domain-containing protein [Cyanothece sp. SIO1E1]|nr:DUF305 domain-containing protein [Cyanothece sp. SIO1E1]
MGHEGHGMTDMSKEEPEEMQDKMEQDLGDTLNRTSDMSHMADNGMEEDHSMMDHSAMHDHSKMAGMLTQIQLEELADAKGKDFDRLFLRYMIQHHAGAITMVNELISTDGAVQDVQLNKLAADINVDQKTEIERMRLMLMQLLEEENGE